MGPKSAAATSVPVVSRPPSAPLSPPLQAVSNRPTELMLSPSASARVTNSRRETPPRSSCSTNRSSSLRLLTRVPPGVEISSARQSAQPIAHPVITPRQWEEPGKAVEQGNSLESFTTEVRELGGPGDHLTHAGAEVGRQGHTVPTISHRVVDPAK